MVFFFQIFLQHFFEAIFLNRFILQFSIPRYILERRIIVLYLNFVGIIENSIQNTPPLHPFFFLSFFVGKIFKRRIVFFYLCKYFGTRNGEFCRKSPFFVLQHFLQEIFLDEGLYFSISGNVLELGMVNCVQSALIFCNISIPTEILDRGSVILYVNFVGIIINSYEIAHPLFFFNNFVENILERGIV